MLARSDGAVDFGVESTLETGHESIRRFPAHSPATACLFHRASQNFQWPEVACRSLP